MRKNHIKTILFLSLLVINFEALAQCTRGLDSLTLIRVNKQTNGEAWLNKWDFRKPINEWFGVELSESGCLKGLFLNGNNLSGEIDIFSLPSLEVFHCHNNSLTGRLPNNFSSSLLEFSFFNNKFDSGNFSTKNDSFLIKTKGHHFPKLKQTAISWINEQAQVPDSEIFPNWNTKLFEWELKNHIELSGDKIKQTGQKLCGPTAISYLMLSLAPDNYAKFLFELRERGTINSKKVRTKRNVFQEPITESGKIKKLKAIDWFFMHGLMDLKSTIGFKLNLTLPKEFSEILINLDCAFIVKNEMNQKLNKRSFGGLLNWIQNDNWVVLFVDSRQYRYLKPEKNDYNGSFKERLVGKNYGNHYIVVKTLQVEKDNSITIQFWDHGSMKELSFENLASFLRASKRYWKIQTPPSDSHL